MKKILLLCICFAFTLITYAQTEDKKWNIGLQGGITQYAGDLGSDFYKFDQAWYGFGGLTFSR
jgi:OmpA-OmpF porin, OOP family